MSTYIIRRGLVSIVFLFLTATAIFFFVHILPGDPISALLGESGGRDAEMVAALRSQLGLDKPLILQYLKWIKGDLGRSLFTNYRLCD